MTRTGQGREGERDGGRGWLGKECGPTVRQEGGLSQPGTDYSGGNVSRAWQGPRRRHVAGLTELMRLRIKALPEQGAGLLEEVARESLRV